MQLASGQDASLRFKFLRCLGQGATGRVFEVEDTISGARLALKQLRRDRQLGPEQISRFKDEFRLLKGIVHPNLVSVYELIADERGVYVLMELVEGLDFLSYVRPDHQGDDHGARPFVETESNPGARVQSTFCGEVDASRLRSALAQLASGLGALHRCGMVHCDIKPEHVLVTGTGRVVILDFGLATAAGSEPGKGRGTPAFMAPEQFDGHYSEAADWYSVGVVLYAALAGRLPYAEPAGALLHAKLFSQPLDPRIQAHGLPNDLVDLSLRLLNPNPGSRLVGDLKALDRGIRRNDSDSGLCFIGRSDEVGSLTQAFNDARQARLPFVHVHGESGIGKTALLDQFANVVEERRGRVFRGACHLEASVPYKGLDSIVDRLAAAIAGLDELVTGSDLAPLATLFPVFRRLVHGDASAAECLHPATLRTRAVSAMRWLLQSLARHRPVVLIIDDVQWADRDSIELIADIFHEPAPSGVLVVLSYRTDARTGDRARYLRDRLPAERVVGLEPLRVEEMSTLLSRASLEGSVVEAIIAESRGNPFFAGEFIRARRNEITGVSLDAVLAFRAGRLDAAQRRYLELVSVAGLPIEDNVVADALGATRETAIEARRVLLSLSFLRVVADGRRAVEPYHHRIREYVVRSLAPSALLVRHEALAAAYETSGVADPETLARHLRAAGASERALTFMERAGDLAAASLAFERAARLFRSALELASPEARKGLRMKLAQALSDAGHAADAAREYMTVSAEDPSDVEIRLAAGEEFLRAGDAATGLLVLSEIGRALGEPIPLSNTVAKVRFVWNGLRVRTMRLRFLPSGAPNDHDRRRLSLTFSIARRLPVADVLRAALFQHRYLIFALRVGSRVDVVQGLAVASVFAAHMPIAIAGGVKRATELLRVARELGRPEDPTTTRGVVEFARGELHLAHGEWRKSREAFERVVALYKAERGVREKWGIALCQSLSIVATLATCGDVQTLRARLPEYAMEARGYCALEALQTLRGSTLIALCDDRAADARRIAREAMKAWSSGPWRLPHHFHAIAMCEVDLYEGEAHTAMARLIPAYRASDAAGFLRVPLFRIPVLALRTRAALACGRYRHAMRDVKRLARLHERWARALAATFGALLLRIRGRRASVEPALAGAVAELERCELRLYASAARYRLAEVRGDRDGMACACAELTGQGLMAPKRWIRSLLPYPSEPTHYSATEEAR